MNKLLLFDIDGTLLRAGNAPRNAITAAFRDIFGNGDQVNDVRFTGKTDISLFHDAALKILGRKLDDGEFERITSRYVSLLPAELERADEFFLMPGIAELLPLLANMNHVVLGLQTGNLEPSAYMKLYRGGIDTYFKFGGFGTDSDDRAILVRTAIERARRFCGEQIPGANIYVIGDTIYDIRAGKACGVNTIAVGTGYPSRQELEDESPTAFLPDLNDIDSFLHLTGGEIS